MYVLCWKYQTILKNSWLEANDIEAVRCISWMNGFGRFFVRFNMLNTVRGNVDMDDVFMSLRYVKDATKVPRRKQRFKLCIGSYVEKTV